MAHAWNGADPTQSSDPASYELGVEYLVGAQAITITAVRVWEGSSPGTFNNRMGRVWTNSGSLLGSASMPTSLPSGWSQYDLSSPVVVQPNGRVVVSYSTGGNYGQLVHGLDNDVVSADGAVTALSGAHGAHGNGSFTTSPGTFPTSASGNNTFYGIDIAYTLGSGTQPPTITGMTVTAVGGLATATINATDPITMVGATFSFDWGDGHVDSGLSSNTDTHAYAANGTYAVLGTVTDAFDLSAYAARPVTIVLPASGFDPQGLTNQLVSMAQSTGLLGPVSGHEPASLPATGIAAAIWMQGIQPARKLSGLSATAARVEYRMRIYTPMATGNMDSIDPAMTTAVSVMIGLLSADFTFGGEIFAVDLEGIQGAPLSAKADYYRQGDQFYRIYDITVPLVCDNVWAQASGV